MSYLGYSIKFARFLVSKTGQSQEKEEILAYAVEVLTLNLLNILCTVFLGFLLGVLQNTLICFFTASILRLFAGGAHSNSPWRCTAITALIFPLMGITGAKLALLENFSVYILLILSALISALTLYRLAPVDSPSAPVISTTRRKRLKTLSLTALAILICLLLIIVQYTPAFGQYIACFSLALLWNAFILTSFGHLLFRIIDQIFNKKRGN
ncbi:MAG: accessory gene regulator B family protein [Clostridiales bacterium]|nr:accessory gene regulator B family protein [Clostridiales bacterium]MCF8022322.1 accessory gene regulator B family protein [Clostridiales bacterium]